MIDHLLKDSLRTFIETHKNADPVNLLLKKEKFRDIALEEAVEQIICHQKVKGKLPAWSSNANIIFPSPISCEQSTSEKVAEFKMNLFSGSFLIDLTGGLGVDSYYFSKSFDKVIYVEIDKKTAACASNNFKMLNSSKIEVINVDAKQYLESYNFSLPDYFYLDPARRIDSKEKTILPENYSPNIFEIIPVFKKYQSKVIFKTSPVLDINEAVKNLEYVEKIWIISLHNECKELLFLLNFNSINHNIQSICVNLLSKQKEVFTYAFNGLNQQQSSAFSIPLKYLYEPNASVMKAQCFNEISQFYKMPKLSSNSHLYTSHDYVDSFPGRKFEIEKLLTFNQLKKEKIYQANISVRNYPQTVHSIRKVTGIKEGGYIYIFATRDLDNKGIIIVTRKV
ncbi:MAG TPA: hypothetical protein ACFCUD_02390 [Cyclobacteriaceae bacterium]